MSSQFNIISDSPTPPSRGFSIAIQTDIREMAMQTEPWTATSIAPTGLEPEVAILAPLTVAAGTLNLDHRTIEEVSRLRARRDFEKTLPEGSSPAAVEQQIIALAERETMEWQERERAVAAAQDARLKQLEAAIVDRAAAAAADRENRLAALRARKAEEIERTRAALDRRMKVEAAAAAAVAGTSTLASGVGAGGVGATRPRPQLPHDTLDASRALNTLPHTRTRSGLPVAVTPPAPLAASSTFASETLAAATAAAAAAARASRTHVRAAVVPAPGTRGPLRPIATPKPTNLGATTGATDAPTPATPAPAPAPAPTTAPAAIARPTTPTVPPVSTEFRVFDATCFLQQLIRGRAVQLALNADVLRRRSTLNELQSLPSTNTPEFVEASASAQVTALERARPCRLRHAAVLAHVGAAVFDAVVARRDRELAGLAALQTRVTVEIADLHRLRRELVEAQHRRVLRWTAEQAEAEFAHGSLVRRRAAKTFVARIMPQAAAHAGKARAAAEAAAAVELREKPTPGTRRAAALASTKGAVAEFIHYTLLDRVNLEQELEDLRAEKEGINTAKVNVYQRFVETIPNN